MVFFDADSWLKAEDMIKLAKIIERRRDLSYVYPKLIHLPKFYPKSFVRFGNFLLGDLIGWPFFILFNNILNAPLTLTNVFAIRREDFVEFKALYPGEDFDFGYRMKKKVGKRNVITFAIKSYTFDRRFAQSDLPRWLRALAPFQMIFTYLFHGLFFVIFKKPLPTFRYREIR
ncbi:hypothetical protein QDY65_06395 [Pyrococcus kukulkanii]|uniref:hypothetical protein n=1 Tax=Pyrococcus kukulkanii TaxID=1609559 RepID=UPI0035698A5B